MKYSWLKNNNKNLIVFFNGWAMGTSAIESIENTDFDILVLSDYSNFEIDFNKFNFENYDKKYLVCWSMGVYVSNIFYDIFNNFDKKISINGTQKIIDDNFGIPQKIFNLTLKTLNDENLNKFIQNMFNKSDKVLDLTINKSIDDLKNELVSIKNLSFDNFISFDKAIISTHDKIVPSVNQKRFWTDKCNMCLVNAGHYPFVVLDCWDKIIC